MQGKRKVYSLYIPLRVYLCECACETSSGYMNSCEAVCFHVPQYAWMYTYVRI